MAGVRGTVVIADVALAAGGTITTRFTLLTGIVDVARVDTGTGQPAGALVTLRPLQTIAVTGATPPGAVRAITRAEAQSLAADYKVSLPPPSPSVNTQVTEQQIDIAVRHSAALTGARSDGDDGTASVAELAGTGDAGDSAGDRTVTIAVGIGPTGGASAPAGATGVGGRVSVSNGTATVGAGVAVGGGGIGAGANLALGGGTIAGGANLAVGGGTIGAGAGVGVGGIGGSGGVTLGGGGLTVGGGVGVAGIGVGGGVTVGSGGGGIGAGGGDTGGGGGLLGVVVPKILPLP
jgi:hypothetical protein